MRLACDAARAHVALHVLGVSLLLCGMVLALGGDPQTGVSSRHSAAIGCVVMGTLIVSIRRQASSAGVHRKVSEASVSKFLDARRLYLQSGDGGGAASGSGGAPPFGAADPESAPTLPAKSAPHCVPCAVSAAAICAICLDELLPAAVGSPPAAVMLDCKHIFHQDCMKQVLSRGLDPRCPLCRSECALP